MSRKVLLAAVLLLAAAFPAGADYFCQRFEFSQERWIKLGVKAGDLEVQDIQFEFPSFVGPRKLKIQGRNVAVMNVKNYGTTALRVHLAVALFDESGNLVGCGTTGSKLGNTRPGETETFFVAFDYVKTRLAAAKTFYLTVETEPG